MHISIGAAILIVGLLWLATSKAGLKVLGVLFVVAVVGGGGFIYWLEQQAQQHEAQYSTQKAEERARCQGIRRLRAEISGPQQSVLYGPMRLMAALAAILLSRPPTDPTGAWLLARNATPHPK